MVEKEVIDKTEEKLPHNLVDMSVEANLTAALKKKQSLGGNKEIKPKSKPGGYLKCRMIKGRPYWYRVLKVKDKTTGKWKNKETYLGTRKPRE